MFNIEDYAKYSYTTPDEERFDGYFIADDEICGVVLGRNIFVDDIFMADIVDTFETIVNDAGYTLGEKDETTQLRQIKLKGDDND